MKLHDRMPVILADEESITTWLDTSSGQWSDNLAKLLKPFDLPDGLVSYPVPKEVGKVGNQSPDFLKVSLLSLLHTLNSLFKILKQMDCGLLHVTHLLSRLACL
jgi:hypothetical protein